MLDIEALRRSGDELADGFVASLLDFDDLPGSNVRLSAVMEWFRSVEKNDDLKAPVFPPGFDAQVGSRLREFLAAATQLPAVVDREGIATTEAAFAQKGYLSSLIYLCASLPEVYAVPTISSILHVTGQLEKVAEQRIRSTATMVLSVLLEGGLLSGDGVGLAMTLRTRIVHSIMRVLLVRGRPGDIREFDAVIPPISTGQPPASVFELAHANGWDLRRAGIPCNQSEMLFTLLTFSFVYLRSVRRLRLRLTAHQEAAYLQTWNLVGWHMGIDARFLPQTYRDAEAMFEQLQAASGPHGPAGAAHEYLGKALIAPLERSFARKSLRPLARLLTQYLTSKKTIQTLKLWGRLDAILYKALPFSMAALKLSDRIVGRFSRISLTSDVYRMVSLTIIEGLLLDDEKPLALPPRQVQQVEKLVARWKSRALVFRPG